MAQRHLTLEDINDKIIPEILKFDHGLKDASERVDKIRNILKEQNIHQDVETEIASILFQSDDYEQKLYSLKDLININKDSISPKYSDDIYNILYADISLKKRMDTTLLYLIENKHFSNKDLQNITVFQDRDYLEILKLYRDSINNQNSYENINNKNSINNEDLKDVLNGIINSDSDSIKELIEFNIEIDDEFQNILDKKGDIVNKYLFLKLKDYLETIDEDYSRIAISIMQEDSYEPQARILLLYKHLKQFNQIDVPNWLLQLMEGDMEQFHMLRINYKKIIEQLEEEQEKREEEEEGEIDNSVILKNIESVQKGQTELKDLGKNYVNFVINLEKAADVFDKFLEYSKVLTHVKKFDYYDLLKIFLATQKENISYNYRLNTIRASLQNIKIETNLDDFIKKYLDNYPRLMTKRELEDVLEVVPLPKGDISIAECARESMIWSLYMIFKNERITPLGIDKLKEVIKIRFNSAQQYYGQSVGIQAATSIGEMITQMTLDSFHQAGSALSIVDGITRMEELINVKMKEDPKSAANVIFWKSKYSFQDIKSLLLERDLTVEEIENINFKYEDVYIKGLDITQIKVKQLYKDEPVINKYEEILEDADWLELYQNIFNDGKYLQEHENQYVLKFEFDVNELFKHKILVTEIIETIQKNHVKCSDPDCLRFVYPPTSGDKEELYIIPNPESIDSVIESEQLSTENNSLIYLNRILEPFISNLKVKGVEKIEKTYVDSVNVWNTVDDIIKTSKTWIINVDDLKRRHTGTFNIHIAILCQAAGYKIKSISDDGVNLEIWHYEDNDPNILIPKMIKEDKDDFIEKQIENKENSIVPSRRPETAIHAAATRYYTITKGNNLQRLLLRNDVEEYISHSNIPIQEFKLFGIEACRTCYLIEFKRVLAGEGTLKINPRHVQLLVDYMIVNGIPKPLNYTGLSDNTDAISLATFRNPTKAITEGALAQAVSSTDSISVAIMTGQKAKVGTGMVKTDFDREKLKELINIDFEPDSVEFEQIVNGYNYQNNFIEKDVEISRDIIKDTQKIDVQKHVNIRGNF